MEVAPHSGTIITAPLGLFNIKDADFSNPLSQVINIFVHFFAKTPILIILTTILRQPMMANFSKKATMAVLVWVDMAINMVNIDVSVKNRKIVDNL